MPRGRTPSSSHTSKIKTYEHNMIPKVIIVGGGLGGLCLGQGLKKARVPFRIFERDTSANWRGQVIYSMI